MCAVYLIKMSQSESSATNSIAELHVYTSVGKLLKVSNIKEKFKGGWSVHMYMYTCTYVCDMCISYGYNLSPAGCTAV